MIGEPGPFRTEFLGDSMKPAVKMLPDHQETAGQTRTSVVQRNGKQPGNPALTAAVIIKEVTSPKPPLHLRPGGFAFERFTRKLDAIRREVETWCELAMSTDFKA